MRSMEDHLSPQDLTRLPGSPEVLADGSLDEQQLNAHLQQCGDCAALVRGYYGLQRAASALAAPVQGTCPPEMDWLEFANGLRPQDTEVLLAHAATCGHCSAFLREALALVGDDELAPEANPVKEGHGIVVKDLASANPEWQDRLAARLSDMREGPPVAQTSATGWLSSLIASFSLARVALATLVLGALALAAWEHQKAVNAERQLGSLQAEVLSLQQLDTRPGTTISRVHPQGDEEANLENPLRLSRPEGVQLTGASYLSAGLTRSAGGTKRVYVPEQATSVDFVLGGLDGTEGMLREELLTADNKLKWAQEFQPQAISLQEGRGVLLSIPAYLLTPDDYQIVVKKDKASENSVAVYTFRALRPSAPTSKFNPE